jgi:hypothetical protein
VSMNRLMMNAPGSRQTRGTLHSGEEEGHTSAAAWR